MGIRTASPKDYNQGRDYNAGVDMCRDLEGYFRRRGRRAKRFFKDLINNPHVNALLDEIEEVTKRCHNQHRTGDKDAFHRMTQMKKPQFARCELDKMSRASQ
jgi:hypothetical protein